VHFSIRRRKQKSSHPLEKFFQIIFKMQKQGKCNCFMNLNLALICVAFSRRIFGKKSEHASGKR